MGSWNSHNPTGRSAQLFHFRKQFQYLKFLGIFLGYNSRSGITGPQRIFLGIYQPEITAYFHKRHI